MVDSSGQTILARKSCVWYGWSTINFMNSASKKAVVTYQGRKRLWGAERRAQLIIPAKYLSRPWHLWPVSCSWWYRSTSQFITSSAAKLISTSAEMSSRCRSKALEVLLFNRSVRKWHFLSPLQSCEQHFRLVDFVFTLVRFNGGTLLFLNVLYLYFLHRYFYRFLFIFRRNISYFNRLFSYICPRSFFLG